MPHTHNIVDAGNHFVIDPSLRSITASNPEIVLVQGDHNSERYTFEIPRMIEGHDMLMCNRIEVHYDNISKNKKELSEGVYLVDDANVDGSNLIFSWLVSGNATRLAGTMQFGINFRCIDANDEVTYAWGTDTFKSVRVIANNQNTDVVVASFPDVLEQWKKEVVEDIDVDVSDEQVSAAVFDYLDKNPVTSGSTAIIGTVELLASKWVKSESSDRLYYQEGVAIDDIPENFDIESCQVDLTPSVEQLIVFYEKDLTFVTENEEGNVIVYAIGQKPENDYVIQVTLTEVGK